MSPAASTRWCPTPEQVMILEEMYRGGVRTPNAAQIQQITAHLSLYGKIEGKNVFYWFQNHKARDRQKLRKRLLGKHLQQQHQMMFHADHQHIQQPSFIHPLHFDNHQPPCYVPTSLGFHQLAHVNSPCFAAHHQARAEDTFTQLTNTYAWKKVDTTHAKFGLENEKPIRINDNDWMMRGDHHYNYPLDHDEASTRRPLKTLELFPIKDKTSLKEDLACLPTNS